MELSIPDRILRFVRVELIFSVSSATDVFREMNSQTVADMIAKKKYAHLKQEVLERYGDQLENGSGNSSTG